MPKMIDVLLVDDNPADVELVQETLKECKFACNLHTAGDGVDALDFLFCRNGYQTAVRPDLILLDLNMPRKDGREVLAELKSDPILKVVPVVIMTSSEAEEDVLRSYELHANAYVTKPVDLESFTKIVQALEDFWFTVVKLPKRN
ncbi:response regulator [Aestuariispira ectoiniformans]|uniref:response regulator n=1 Tax=Aestuariispira ectoiniformans TaxID=2775080 RepID=UPI00223B47EA|nr:response regulator [Aestuariispira ectoiniformans]